MKYFIKDSQNNFFFHANDSTAKTFFTVELLNLQTKETKIFSGTDISSGTTNYNLFNVILTSSTEILTASTLSLDEGTYNYTIYDNDSINLAITGTVCEKGIIKVSGTTSDTFNYYMQMSGTTDVVWE